MSIELEINGIVEIPDGMSHDDFLEIFIKFLESNNCYFGGVTRESSDEMIIETEIVEES